MESAISLELESNTGEAQSPPGYGPPITDRGGYRWTVVAMLWFICFFNYADRTAIYALFPVLHKNFGFNKTQLGTIGAAFTWVYAMMSPVAGDVGDRFPRKTVILVGLYIWSLVTGLTAQCSRVWQFVFVRSAEGFGETFYMPASMALISDYHAPSTRSRAIGLHQTSIYAGTIGGATLAGWMAEKWGWRSPFWALAFAGIILGFVLNLVIREPRRNQAELAERAEDLKAAGEPEEVEKPHVHMPMSAFLLEFFANPAAMLLIAAFFGANLVGYVFISWMPTFLTEKFHLNLAMSGLGATFFIQVASILGAILGGVLADRRMKQHRAGRIQVQCAAILFGAPFIFVCGYTRLPIPLMISMTMFGLCKGIYDASLTASFYDVLRPNRRSTATGLMNFIGWLGAGLGTLGIGVAVDKWHVTMSVAISSTALIYLVTAIFLFLASLQVRRHHFVAGS